MSLSQLRDSIPVEQILDSLTRQPEWLKTLAKTPDELKKYQELLDKWQTDKSYVMRQGLPPREDLVAPSNVSD